MSQVCYHAADAPAANGHAVEANGKHAADTEINGDAHEDDSDAEDGPEVSADAAKKKKKKKSKGMAIPSVYTVAREHHMLFCLTPAPPSTAKLHPEHSHAMSCHKGQNGLQRLLPARTCSQGRLSLELTHMLRGWCNI